MARVLDNNSLELRVEYSSSDFRHRMVERVQVNWHREKRDVWCRWIWISINIQSVVSRGQNDGLGEKTADYEAYVYVLYMRTMIVFMYGFYTGVIYVYNHRHTMSVTDVVQPLWRVVYRSRCSAQT